MSRIQLYVLQSLRTPEGQATETSGAVIRVPFLRTFVHVRLGTTPSAVLTAIIDTGAPLTVLPWHAWQRVADEIEWLSPVSDPDNPSWLTHLSGHTGGSVSCRLGRLQMSAHDLRRPPRKLAPVSVLVSCEEEPREDDRIIVGLHGSILQNRRLLVDVDAREAWLADR